MIKYLGMTDDVHATLRTDPVLAELLEKHDLQDNTYDNEFERLCVSIINQQLSTESAQAVRERVFSEVDEPFTPQAVLRTDENALRDAGLSARKVEYLRHAARAFEENDYTKEGLAAYSNREIIDRLTEIKGVGEWTANMYLIFVLERQDVLPLGDLAVRRGIEQLYGSQNSDGEMTREEMREIAEGWRPYRSIATRYIWAEYESA